jgi:hypothetical protein
LGSAGITAALSQQHGQRAGEKGTGMTTAQVVSSRKQTIDALTSDFFRAVSFLKGDKPAYQEPYKLFIERGQLKIVHSCTKYPMFVNVSNLANA